MSSKLVAECQDALLALENRSEVTLLSMPRHYDTLRNLDASTFTRQASQTQPLCPESALGIPKCLARESIKNWTKLQHLNKWIHMPGCKHGKLFIGRPCKKGADDLLKLNRRQLKLVVAILTWHDSVWGHLRNVGQFEVDPSCRFCGMQTERVQHLVCHCEALSC